LYDISVFEQITTIINDNNDDDDCRTVTPKLENTAFIAHFFMLATIARKLHRARAWDYNWTMNCMQQLLDLLGVVTM